MDPEPNSNPIPPGPLYPIHCQCFMFSHTIPHLYSLYKYNLGTYIYIYRPGQAHCNQIFDPFLPSDSSQALLTKTSPTFAPVKYSVYSVCSDWLVDWINLFLG